MSGPVKIVLEPNASLRVGNFNIIGGLDAPTVVDATSGLNIKFKNICDEKSDYWNLYIDVDVLGETLSIASDNTTTGEKYGLRITDNGVSSELTVSAALGLNSDLLNNTDTVNMIGILDLLDKFSADRTLIPAVDVSAAIDNIEFVRTDNVTSTSLIAYDLYASMKTSAEGFVADVSFEDISVYTTETNVTSDGSSKDSSKNIANTLYSAEQCKINLVWSDKITLSGKISDMRYESIKGEYTITKDTGYTLDGSASTDRGSISQISIEADLSAEGLKELLKDPLTIDFSKIKADVKIKASIDNLEIDSNNQTYYHTSDEIITEDKINNYLTSDNWVRITASAESTLEFSTNGSVSAYVKLKELSILDKNTDVKNSENNCENRIYVKGASVSIDASHAQIMKLICYTIVYKEDVELTDVLPIILDKSKIDVEVGLEEFTLSEKKKDRDFEIGITSNTPGKQAANVKLNAKCTPTINPFKPDVSVSVVMGLTPDSTVNLMEKDENVTKITIRGVTANASLNGSFDVLGLINGNISKLESLKLNAEASVSEIEIIQYNNENYTRMVIENPGLKMDHNLFELIYYIKDANMYDAYIKDSSIPSVTIYSGNNKNNRLDTNNPYNQFIFKNGKYVDDLWIFDSPEIVKSINGYSDTITGKNTKILPASFKISDGKFFCDPVTMENGDPSPDNLCISAYTVEGLSDSVYTIAAGTKITVFPTTDNDGFRGWHVNGEFYKLGTTITIDRNLVINEIYENYVTTELFVDSKVWRSISMVSGDIIHVQDPELENHRFVGWFDSDGEDAKEVTTLKCTDGGILCAL